MSFSLTVEFSGLMHYVQNTQGPNKSSCNLCVVLPKAADHQAQMVKLVGVIKKNNSDEVENFDFAEKRVVFQFEKTSPPPQSLDFDFEGPILRGPVKGAVPFNRILGTSADASRKIVSAVPPPGRVNSQILVGGEVSFSLDASDSPPEVEIPGVFSGGGILKMAEKIKMQVDGLKSVKLLILPLNKSLIPDAVYWIYPANGQASLLVSHDCAAANLVNGAPGLHPGDDDKDFRFHYSLLDAFPPGFQLENMPVPKINKFSADSQNFHKKDDLKSFKPNGCNCAGSSGIKRFYKLDRFMAI